MVRVLSNGELVQDNDPRVTEQRSAQQSSSREAVPGQIGRDEDVNNGPGGGNNAYEAGLSMFHTLNQRLLDVGVPRWNAGPYVVEPLVSAGLLLAFVLFGFRGLIFGGLLFAVSVWSQGRNSGLNSDPRPPGGRPPASSSSGGHRLG